MGYKITMSEIGPISLNETDPVKSILQNVSIILRTIKAPARCIAASVLTLP